MYVLLTGCKKNAGDFMIAHAAKRLIKQFAPSSEYLELPAWKPIDEHIGKINSSSALILCGGPAFQLNLGRTIYPIIPSLSSIKVPIISFGLGWKGVPGDEYDVKYSYFRPCAEPLFERLKKDFIFVGCRDNLTLQVLRNHGFENALMTGCPVWYDPDYFDKELVIPSHISRIVYTPAEQPFFQSQSIAMMEVIKELFPDAQIVCSFHRGWEVDEYTSERNARNAQYIKKRAEELGFETRDVSGSADGMLEYDRFDLHIGYRVHGHLKMLSMRKLSFLIGEDSRARGALEAMDAPGVCGWNTAFVLGLCNKFFPNNFARKAARKAFGPFSLNPLAPQQLKDLITEETKNNYSSFQSVLSAMDNTWEDMLKMLKALPI